MSREVVEKKFRESVEKGSPTAWFHDVYELADQGEIAVPWDDGKPNPWMVQWFNDNPVPAGTKTLDVACGLGDNAEFLQGNGLKVVAADISPKAIELAQKRFANSSVEYKVADFLTPPDEFVGAFDFVSEVYTLQALPESHRYELLRGIASCVAPRGLLLIVARHLPAGAAPKETPPFSLTQEFTDQLLNLGFTRISFQAFEDQLENTPIHRLVATYRKN